MARLRGKRGEPVNSISVFAAIGMIVVFFGPGLVRVAWPDSWLSTNVLTGAGFLIVVIGGVALIALLEVFLIGRRERKGDGSQD